MNVGSTEPTVESIDHVELRLIALFGAPMSRVFVIPQELTGPMFNLERKGVLYIHDKGVWRLTPLGFRLFSSISQSVN